MFCPGVEAEVEDACEVALGCSADFSWGLSFGGLAGEVCLGVWVVALLDDRDAVERGAELAAAVEAMAAEPRECAGVAEPTDIAGLEMDRGGEV